MLLRPAKNPPFQRGEGQGIAAWGVKRESERERQRERVEVPSRPLGIHSCPFDDVSIGVSTPTQLTFTKTPADPEVKLNSNAARTRRKRTDKSPTN